MALRFKSWWSAGRATTEQLLWEWSNSRQFNKSRQAESLRVKNLERRLLMSAAPIDAAALVLEGSNTNAVDSLNQTFQSDQGTTGDRTTANLKTVDPTSTNAPQVVVFVDSAVAELESVLSELDRSSSQADVFVLQSERDGVEQISEALRTRSGLDGVHIISHADGSAVRLGSTWLSLESLSGQAGNLAAWGSSLSADADILFYGCDLASQPEGHELLESVAALTGADVAASVNTTGHLDFSADWELEYSTGSIEQQTIVSAEFQDAYRAKLSVIQVTTTSVENDTGMTSFDIDALKSNPGIDGRISLTEAIIAANHTAGLDTIHFDISTPAAPVIDVLSQLPIITDAVVIDATTQPGYSNQPLVFLNGNDLLANGLVLGENAGGSTIRGLGIVNFGYNGIVVGSGDNSILGNWIGAFDPVTSNTQSSLKIGHSGIYVTGSGNTIGGQSATDRNLIGGNGHWGIVLSGSAAHDNSIIGNWIGVAADGSLVAQNGLDGIGVFSDADENLISGNMIGNSRHGIQLEDSSDNVIIGNAIGTDFLQSIAIGNTHKGILIEGDSDNNEVGRYEQGNIIVGNGLDGIAVRDSSTGNTIRYNQITGNGELAIDLGGDGYDNNDYLDLDGGGNQRQNKPTLHGATVTVSGQLMVDLELYSKVLRDYRIDFYEASTEYGSVGDPERYLGYSLVSTSLTGYVRVIADGNVTGVINGDLIVATATDLDGNTSEVSASVSTTLISAVPVIGNIEASILHYIENSGPIQVSNEISVAIPGANAVQSAMVSIDHYQSDQDVLRFNDTSKISGHWNASTGILTLTGDASASEYQAALRSVRYENTSDRPCTDARSIEFTVNSAGQTSTTIARTVIPVSMNDPTVGQPMVIGIALEGQTLSASTAGISDADGISNADYQYQWLRDGKVIDGAEGQQYFTSASDIGSQLSVRVTFADDHGSVIELQSDPFGPIAAVDQPATGAPKIVGSAAEYETLSVDLSAIEDADGLSSPGFSFQWFRGANQIDGATADQYQLTADDIGAQIRVVVTFTDDEGFESTVASDSVGPVANVNDLPTGQPEINGVLIEGERLTADLSSIADKDGLPSNATLQWLRDGKEIDGADRWNYRLTEFDVGTRISVRVTYTDLQGTTEVLVSQQTELIQAQNSAPTLEDRTRSVPFGETLNVGPKLFANASNDVDGDALVAVLVSGPKHGELQVSEDGSFVYIPEAEFFGIVTFTWQAYDGELHSDVATVTIVIAPPISTPGVSNNPNNETGDDPSDPGSSDENNSSDANEGDPSGDNGNSGGTNEETPAGESNTGPIDSNESVGDVVDHVEILNESRLDEQSSDRSSQIDRSGGLAPLDDRIRQIDSLDSSIDSQSTSLLDSTSDLISETIVWADYAMFNSSAEMWDQLDHHEDQLKDLLDNQQLIVGSFGAATGGFTMIALAWLRNGFLLLGFWQQRPIWSGMDPLVLMKGLKSEDDESLTDVIANERKRLDEASARGDEE